ncbi:MAG: DUF4422 domain-containing protein [[Eubacterium] siraeum]
MASKKYYAYNCFVMSKELFNRFCTFEFGVLFEFMKRFDMSKYQGTKMRTPGYMSEVLYGIFIYWVLKQRKYKVKENQLVFFRETNAAKCKLAPAKTAAAPKKAQKAQKSRKHFKEDNEKHLPCISCCFTKRGKTRRTGCFC